MTLVDPDKIVSFEEWCLNCDIRGVTKFGVTLKNEWQYDTLPALIKSFVDKFPSILVPTKSCNNNIWTTKQYFIITLDQIKELRVHPIGDEIFVASHNLPFSDEVEIQYLDPNDEKYKSLFGYISWNYSGMDHLIEIINSYLKPVAETYFQLTRAKQIVENLGK